MQGPLGPYTVNLSLDAPLTVGGQGVSQDPFVFLLTIDETTNLGAPENCPFPSVIACSDRVRTQVGARTGSFMIGGERVTLYIDGFRRNGVTTADFLAEERANNTVQVLGRFGSTAELTAPVPEPTTWALMIGGFALAGASLRRRRSVRA